MQQHRSKVRRKPNRAAYDQATIEAILDAGSLCHVGFTVDDQAYVIPMAYARDGADLYLHGATASRMLRRLADGVHACATVTLVDGLVLARSAMHHSLNYRSVVAFGRTREIIEEDDKHRALRHLTEHLIPGRWDDIRAPSQQEMKATTVIALPMEEASAKIRSGPPSDAAEDLALETWAGVVPLRTAAGEPLDAPDLATEMSPPRHVRTYVEARS